MNELSLKTISQFLNESYGALERLVARIQFIVFGEVEDVCARSLESSVAREEKASPLTERTLFSELAFVYQLLNNAWSGRHESEKHIRQFDHDDFVRLSQFPDDAVFHDLWPAPSRRVKTLRRSFQERISPNSLQAAFLQTAARKLTILRFRVASEAGEVDGRAFSALQDGSPEHFTEEEFGRRLHHIYGELNKAWACRHDANKPISRPTWHRRRRFPLDFLSRVPTMG